MTYRVDITTRASRDLIRIFESINAANSSEARDWFNGLEAAVLSLDEHPARHPVTPENPSLRHRLYSSRSYVYRIIFRIDDPSRRIRVVHIRHGSQQPI
jgi:toxin ParE1/3/4